MKKIYMVFMVFVCMIQLSSCGGKDTYKLAKKMYEYELHQSGYEETLKMAQKGNYDANCKDCFIGPDTQNISLFAYACSVNMEFAKAIYAHGADIESSNSDFYKTPLLSALYGNRNDAEMIYWLIEEGADINAVDWQGDTVFHNLRFWQEDETSRKLVQYFTEHCDMEYLKEKTKDKTYGKWEDLWDENGAFVFYGK